jgi:MFS family permease
MLRYFHLDLKNIDDRNAWYLCVEIFFASLLTGAASYNSMLAVRLGASNTDIGLLTSIPALLAVFISIPAGRFLQSRPKRKPWILWSLGINRTGYLLLALVPLLKLLNLPAGQISVWLLIAISIPAQFFNIGFIPMLAEAVPEDRWATIFSTRNTINSITSSVFIYLSGQWLNNGIIPVNYQIMYAVAFAASMFSQYFLVKVNAVQKDPLSPMAKASLSRTQAFNFWSVFTGWPEFTRFTRNTFIFELGLWMATPLYVLYYVRILNANEAWIGLNGTIGGIAGIFGYLIWRWVIIRFGDLKVLRLTILWAGFYPLLVGLSGSLTFILFATALNWLIVPGFNVSHLNTFLRIIPEDRRPEYYATFTAVSNFGLFLCPLTGVFLAEKFGFGPMLAACGVLSLLGAASFYLWPVKLRQ